MYYKVREISIHDVTCQQPTKTYTTLNLLDGTPEYKNKLTTPGQCKILQIYLKNWILPTCSLLLQLVKALYSRDRK
jgi:hypothetical protein